MPSLADTFRRALVAVLATLALAAFSIRPAIGAPYDYTDEWYAGPTEAGWGVNFTQTDNFIFATLFIYGPGGQPTWYTAQMTWDGQSKFTGGLYATTGTYYANSWNANNSSNTAVGTASFTPSTQNNYQGTFSYTANVAADGSVKSVEGKGPGLSDAVIANMKRILQNAQFEAPGKPSVVTGTVVCTTDK